MIALPGSSVSDRILDSCEPISAVVDGVLLHRAKDFVLYRALFGACCMNAVRRDGKEGRRCEVPKVESIPRVGSQLTRPGAHAPGCHFRIAAPRGLAAAPRSP